jgi:hypothetical protein
MDSSIFDNCEYIYGTPKPIDESKIRLKSRVLLEDTDKFFSFKYPEDSLLCILCKELTAKKSLYQLRYFLIQCNYAYGRTKENSPIVFGLCDQCVEHRYEHLIRDEDKYYIYFPIDDKLFVPDALFRED